MDCNDNAYRISHFFPVFIHTIRSTWHSVRNADIGVLIAKYVRLLFNITNNPILWTYRCSISFNTFTIIFEYMLTHIHTHFLKLLLFVL